MKLLLLGLSIGLLPFWFCFGYIERGYSAIGAELLLLLIPIVLGWYIYADYKRSKPRYKVKIIRGVGYETNRTCTFR